MTKMEERELDLRLIEGKIGHRFQSIDLLNQALTRKSYSDIYGGENNEVLEFIGDKVLDVAVVKILVDKFGKAADGFDIKTIFDGKFNSDMSLDRIEWTEKNNGLGKNAFKSNIDEGELTKIKSRMVSKHYLPRCIDKLGIGQYILVGSGDCQTQGETVDSAKENVCEAIVGAVALDSGWNFREIINVVDIMLSVESFWENDKDTNYIGLIQEFCLKKSGKYPEYSANVYEGNLDLLHFNYLKKDGWEIYPRRTKDSIYTFGRDRYFSELIIPEFDIKKVGYGSSGAIARQRAAELAYNDLLRRGIIHKLTPRDEIPNPTKEDAIGQLEILARRGYFAIPSYFYTDSYDESGNQIWQSVCHIDGREDVESDRFTSKKDAKKDCAFKMLSAVLEKKAK